MSEQRTGKVCNQGTTKKPPYLALQTYCGKYKCNNTKRMSWAAALPTPQTATTEQMHHYIPQRIGLL